jgi:hypothetical protein
MITSPPFLWADCLENVEASTSHNPMGLHGLLQGLLYLLPTHINISNFHLQHYTITWTALPALSLIMQHISQDRAKTAQMPARIVTQATSYSPRERKTSLAFSEKPLRAQCTVLSPATSSSFSTLLTPMSIWLWRWNLMHYLPRYQVPPLLVGIAEDENSIPGASVASFTTKSQYRHEEYLPASTWHTLKCFTYIQYKAVP